MRNEEAANFIVGGEGRAKVLKENGDSAFRAPRSLVFYISDCLDGITNRAAADDHRSRYGDVDRRQRDARNLDLRQLNAHRGNGR
jgi:hypothetical protein